MVTIARFLNVTPRAGPGFFLGRPQVEFKDIFDVDHFITSLRGEVQIVEELPSKPKVKVGMG